MSYFYLYIFLLVSFIIGVSYLNTYLNSYRESFNSNNNNDNNNKIDDYAKEPKNNITSVLKVSNVLTKPEDFSFGIEPSSNGSNKLVEIIMTSY